MPLEKNLDEKIRRYIKKTTGIWGFKIHGNIFMKAGLPDWICVFKGRFVAFECKLPGKPTTKIQDYIHKKIRGAGGVVERIDTMAGFLELLERVETEHR